MNVTTTADPVRGAATPDDVVGGDAMSDDSVAEGSGHRLAGLRRASRMSRRTLVLMSHAMEHAFAEAVDEDLPGLVLAFFQRREFFDLEAGRYAQLARAGHTVVVAFSGDTSGTPDGVHVVQLAPDDPATDRWTVLLLREGWATYLSAVERGGQGRGGDAQPRRQRAQSFDATWTFRRWLAVDHGTTLLDSLAARLPAPVVDRAREHIRVAATLDVTEVEARLVVAAEYLVHALEVGGQRGP